MSSRTLKTPLSCFRVKLVTNLLEVIGMDIVLALISKKKQELTIYIMPSDQRKAYIYKNIILEITNMP